ncbi:hypothetical protein [Gordonia sp. (in: high G+C Gram-positive bacteria)]|uniref:hypothetical protein n=1 Tax=Gordonia sp. (in: high G+C Gram-positive bacteria) TaxID=84139 RepID=UPI0039E4A27F
MPLDSAAPTSLVAALLAITAERALAPRLRSEGSGRRIVGVDLGTESALSSLLGGFAGGDLVGLADLQGVVTDLAIDSFVDDRTFSGTPVIAPSALSASPGHVTASLERIGHRHFAAFVDVPPSVASLLMAAALSGADWAVAVTTGGVPPWLFTTHNPLQPFLDTERLLIVESHGPTAPDEVNAWGFEIPMVCLDPTTVSSRPQYGLDLSMAPTMLVTVLLQVVQLLLGADATPT